MSADTERKSEAISATEWRQIVQSATETAIITMDPDGNVTSWNEGAHLILGWTENEMLGRSLAPLFEDPEQVERELHDALSKGRGGGLEGWRFRRDGTRIWAAGEMHPIRREDGQVSGFVKILRDRSKQREALETIAEERRALAILNRASAELAVVGELDRLVQIVTDAGVELSGSVAALRRRPGGVDAVG